ncbi:hypothetical protein BOTBODRAFT_78005, partial [Botryobasidium botryosum FD-172 SS1]
GSGTLEDPYVVDWAPGEAENPYNWSQLRRWILTYQLAFGTLCVSFASSAYTGGIEAMRHELHMSTVVSVLGVSLYVLGFGVGPLLLAPLSEVPINRVYSQRIVFLCTYLPFTLFHLGGALAQNATTLLVTRFLAGAFGSSPLTNAGGTITDIWHASERAIPQALYAVAPFCGPIIGPIVGGYVAEARGMGWRWTFWLMLIFASFAPVLLRRRARRLHAESGGTVHYISKFDQGRSLKLGAIMSVNLRRPFVLLFTEPIVFLFSAYIAIVYAILYALFAAFPIVFQQQRHFSTGEGGLAFLGIGAGIVIGTAINPFVMPRIYRNACEKSPDGKAPPEVRLITGCAGSVLAPVGMFWFAWTSYPSIHWIVPILAGAPFGLGMNWIFTSVTAYLMDTYTIYCASAIAASVLLRSTIAAVFPLFTPALFGTLGTQWALTVFAALSLLCAPLPFLFYKYGPRIRAAS